MKKSQEIQLEITKIEGTIKELTDTIDGTTSAMVKQALEASKLDEEKKLAQLQEQLTKAQAIEAKRSIDWSKHEDQEIAKAWAETEAIGSTISFGTKNHANYILDLCMAGAIKKLGLPGPTGTGKTSFARAIGYQTNKPVMAVNGTAGTNKDDLIGTYVATEDGGFKFQEGPLLKMMRVGGIFVMEEMNFIKPQEMAILNSVMDDLRQVYVPELGETVRAHDEFLIIGTWNPGYGGTRDLNAAFMNRFCLVAWWNRMTDKMLTKLCIDKLGTTEARARTLVLVHESIANIIEKHKFDDNAISFRQLAALDKAFTATGNITTAIKLAVLEQVSNGNEDLRKKILAMTEAVAADILKTGTGEVDVKSEPMYAGVSSSGAGKLSDKVKEAKAKQAAANGTAEGSEE